MPNCVEMDDTNCSSKATVTIDELETQPVRITHIMSSKLTNENYNGNYYNYMEYYIHRTLPESYYHNARNKVKESEHNEKSEINCDIKNIPEIQIIITKHLHEKNSCLNGENVASSKENLFHSITPQYQPTRTRFPFLFDRETLPDSRVENVGNKYNANPSNPKYIFENLGSAIENLVSNDPANLDQIIYRNLSHSIPGNSPELKRSDPTKRQVNNRILELRNQLYLWDLNREVALKCTYLDLPTTHIKISRQNLTPFVQRPNFYSEVIGNEFRANQSNIEDVVDFEALVDLENTGE